MAIDDCQHDFSHLASFVLPGYMDEMRKRMRSPIALQDFAAEGSGVATQLCRLSLTQDFEGCYVLMDEKTPIYVGISRGVIARLIQHVKGNTHFDASLAYRMAAEKIPHDKTRSQAMANAEFQTAFESAQQYLRGLSVAFLRVPNPLELYFFEAYCAMELDTKRWNTFRTH